MALIAINLATEDELSEVVLFKILAVTNRYAVGTPYRRGGYGYLRRTIYGWNRAARGVPFVVLTDLDKADCPAALINSWLPVPKHANLLFRVAVHEVESWLLADNANFSSYLRIPIELVPTAPDTLDDPKAKLIDLARRSRSKELRERLVPRAGSTAKQGPDYNGCLAAFVRESWSVSTACINSPSLAKTVVRVNAFAPVWARDS